jgi:DNA polymerase I-like protein with 3'-5' exonuclease and polymerase domains
MKFKGVRVDVEKAHILESQLISQEKALLQQVEKETGIYPEIWAARSIAKVFDKLSLTYPRTVKSDAPSFTKTFLQDHEHPVAQRIAKAREINKMHTTFIQSILKHVHKGRIHADINPIRSDTGGTVTGRFSYANPNLQQMPIRNPEMGAAIRGLFLPEREHLWGSFDYSQQEPRLVVHYAADDENISQQDAVKNIVQQFKNDSVDFHQVVADMAGIERKQAKTINLGLFYGMGKGKLQNELGLEKHEAEELFDQYHANVPFVRQLMRQTMNAAEEDGVIQTIGGRHCRFDRWEINEFTPGVMKKLGTKIEIAELFRERIREQFPEFTDENWINLEKDLTSDHPKKIKRALTYKALNKLIQGSAADMTKQAMLDLYNEGIVPHIQIHDELDISVVDEKQGARVKEIMENVKPGGTTMKVPNKVDAEYGETWGDIKG